jgi:hypothetical protein
LIWRYFGGLAPERSGNLRPLVKIIANTEEPTIVELDACSKELVEHIVRNRLCLDVLEQYPHGRIVRETTILLVEAEVGSMEVKNEGGRGFVVFLKDIGRGPHCLHQHL